MKPQQTYALSVAAALVGGFAAGIFYQSEPFRRLRESLGESARARKRWVENQLHRLEDQIGQLEAQLQSLGEEFSSRIRSTVSTDATAEERQTWKMVEGEVARDLPRMPRS